MENKALALVNMRRQISNGQQTSLWFDPWLQEGRIVELIGRDNCLIGAQPSRRVSSVIINQQWQLTIPGLSHIWNMILDTGYSCSQCRLLELDKF